MKSISDIRRAELRKAAFEVLLTEGVHGTTLDKVATRASASKGILIHHFGSKQYLLEHAMRYSESLLRAEVIANQKIAKTPIERLWAVIVANFAPIYYTHPICNAWLSMSAEVPRNPHFARIQNVCYARTRSNLISPLKLLCPANEIEDIVETLSTLINGLWFKAGVSEQEVDRHAALNEIQGYLRYKLPNLPKTNFLDKTA